MGVMHGSHVQESCSDHQLVVGERRVLVNFILVSSDLL